MADKQIGDFIKDLKRTFEKSESNHMETIETLQGVQEAVLKQTELFNAFATTSKDSLLFQQEQSRDARRSERLSKKDDEENPNLSAFGMLSSDLGELTEAINKLKKSGDDKFSLVITPTLVALGAWLTDLDGYLRAIRPDFILKPISTFVDLVTSVGKGLTEFVNSLKDIRLPGITIDWNTPLVQFIDSAGRQVVDFAKVTFITPAINFVDNLGNVITDVIDYKIHMPALVFKDAVGNVINRVLDIRLPAVLTSSIDNVKTFFTAAGELFTKIARFTLPRIDITIPSFSEFLDPIKNFIGAAGEGAESTGLMKLFSGLKNFINPIMRPLAAVTRIVAGPWVQGFLSLLDFVKGFADGFGATEVMNEFGDVEQLSFGDRILNGLEGGVLGVIKGITDAFEVLFFGIPGWIAEKLGFEETAKYLKGLEITKFVDPIWNWAKDTVGWIVDLLPSWEDIKGYLKNLIPDRFQSMFFDDETEDPVLTNTTPNVAAAYDYSNYVRDQQGDSMPYGLRTNDDLANMLFENSITGQKDYAADMKDLAAYLATLNGGSTSTSVNNNQVYNQQKVVTMVTDPARALRALPGGF